MAMVVRGNFRYYYRSKRIGGKVVRIYCGAQEAADKAAEDHNREQEAKRKRREERIAHNAGCRDLLNRINQQLLIYHHEMFEKGWHKPRGGPWRRRNARTTKLAPIPGIPTRPLLPNWLKEIADPTVGRGGIVPRHLSNTDNPVGRGGIVPRRPSNTDQPYRSEWVVPRLPQVQCSTNLETLPNLSPETPPGNGSSHRSSNRSSNCSSNCSSHRSSKEWRGLRIPPNLRGKRSRAGWGVSVPQPLRNSPRFVARRSIMPRPHGPSGLARRWAKPGYPRLHVHGKGEDGKMNRTVLANGDEEIGIVTNLLDLANASKTPPSVDTPTSLPS